MKGFRRLSKVTGRLYLIMLLMALFCTLIDTASICIDTSGVETGKSIESKITSDINDFRAADNTYILPDEGLDLSTAIYDKTYLSIGFYFTILGIIFLLFMREISFTDKGTREFEMTLPVKKTTLVMHEYMFFFLMIVAMTFLQGIILAAYQSHYNKVWVSVSGLMAAPGFNSIPTARLFTYIVLYTMSLLILYTWIYLGMVLCKNSMLGGCISVVTGYGVMLLFDIYDYDITGLLAGKCPVDIDSYGNIIGDPYLYSVWSNKMSVIDNLLSGITAPGYMFDRIDVNGFMKGSYNDASIFGNMLWGSVITRFVIMAVILLTGILIIWRAAKSRELSRGGQLFYHRFTGYMFTVFCGTMSFVFITENFVLNHDVIYYTIGIICAAGTFIVIGLLNRPVKINADGIFVAKKGLWAKFFVRKRQGDSYGGYNLNLEVLFYKEIRRYALFLIAGLILVYIKVVERSLDFFEYTGTFDIDENIDYAKMNVVGMFDSLASNIFWGFHINIILCMMSILMMSKIYGYWIERKDGTREFLETIPVKRSMRFIFKLVMDMLLVIIPMIFAAIFVSIKFNTLLLTDNNILLEWLPKSIAGVVITDIAYMVMLVGLLDFVEEMFANGMLRPIGFAGLIIMIGYSFSGIMMLGRNLPFLRFISGVFTLKLPGGNYYDISLSQGGEYVHSYINVPIVYKGEILSFNDWGHIKNYANTFYNLYDYSNIPSYIGYVIFYAAIGICFLCIAYHFCMKKDVSSSILNFEFEKYMISAAVSLTLFCVLQPYVVAVWWHRLLITIVCLLCFGTLVYMMTPRESRVIRG